MLFSFVKNDRITISVHTILSIKPNEVSLVEVSFKKVLNGQSDIHVAIKCVFIFLQIVIQNQKD